MRNKKAQIATALLIVIALGLSSAVLYAMMAFENDFYSRASEMENMIKKLDFMHLYIMEKSKQFAKETITSCQDCSYEQIKQKASEFDAKQFLRTEEAGNFFAKLRHGNFSLQKSNEFYILQVENLFVQSSSNNNKLIRKFEICQIFNKTGDFISNCENKESQKSE